ncbi:Uncharacterised protein [Mycobacteroides abscessus subsp. abscessus]|nr:Uncharacterised protein [Mycobacteroides abscessus subsp. abscessus]
MRTVWAGSLYSSCGAEPCLTFFSMDSHCALSRVTSRISSSSEAPSAAVRTITEASSSIRLPRMSLRR